MNKYKCDICKLEVEIKGLKYCSNCPMMVCEECYDPYVGLCSWCAESLSKKKEPEVKPNLKEWEAKRPRLIPCPKCGNHTFKVSKYHYYGRTKRYIRMSGSCSFCNCIEVFSKQLIQCPKCGHVSFGIVRMFLLERLPTDPRLTHWVPVSLELRHRNFSSKNPCLTHWMCFSCGHQRKLLGREGRVYAIFWSKKFPHHTEIYRCPKCNATYTGRNADRAIAFCEDCGRLGCLRCGVRTYFHVGVEWVEEKTFMKRKRKPKEWRNLPTKTLCLDCLAESSDTNGDIT